MAESGAAEGPSANLVSHFTVLSVSKYNKTYKCNYCSKELSGSGFRCAIHLTGNGSGVAKCPNVPAAVAEAIRATQAKRAAEAAAVVGDLT
jgi:hypothetical protein